MLRKFGFTLLAIALISAVWVGAVSAGQEKVTICHKPDTSAELTLNVAAPAVQAHLNHGDYEGACVQLSEGCQALNALVPDSQVDPLLYLEEVIALFNAGETVHADLTVTNNIDNTHLEAYVLDGQGYVALNWIHGLGVHETGTVSMDHTFVDDGEYTVGVVADSLVYHEGFTVDSVNLSCE